MKKDHDPNGKSTIDTKDDAATEVYVNTLIETNDKDLAEDARQGSHNDGATGQGEL